MFSGTEEVTLMPIEPAEPSSIRSIYEPPLNLRSRHNLSDGISDMNPLPPISSIFNLPAPITRDLQQPNDIVKTHDHKELTSLLPIDFKDGEVNGLLNTEFENVSVVPNNCQDVAPSEDFQDSVAAQNKSQDMSIVPNDTFMEVSVKETEPTEKDNLSKISIVQTTDLQEIDAMQNDPCEVNFAHKEVPMNMVHMNDYDETDVQENKNLPEVSCESLNDLHEKNSDEMREPAEITVPCGCVGIYSSHYEKLLREVMTEVSCYGDNHLKSMEMHPEVGNPTDIKPTIGNQKISSNYPTFCPELNPTANHQNVPGDYDNTEKFASITIPKVTLESASDADGQSVPDCQSGDQDPGSNPTHYDQYECKHEPHENSKTVTTDSSIIVSMQHLVPNQPPLDESKMVNSNGQSITECSDCSECLRNPKYSGMCHSTSDRDPRLHTDSVSLTTVCIGNESKSSRDPNLTAVQDPGDSACCSEPQPPEHKDTKPTDSDSIIEGLMQLITSTLEDFYGSPESFQSPSDDDIATNCNSSKPQHGFISPTEGISTSDCDQSLKRKSMSTNEDNYPGQFRFSFSFDNDPSSKETNSMIYSKALEKLCVRHYDYIPVTFNFDKPPPPECIIRATVVHAEPSHATSPVHRYQKHAKADKEVPPDCKTHLVHCQHPQARYIKHPVTGQHSVTVPLQEANHHAANAQTSADGPDESGLSSVIRCYQFRCSNSCAGLKHHTVKLVFTLEKGDVIFGRQAVDLRICASPNRDLFSKDFMETQKNQQTGRRMAKSKRSTKGRINRLEREWLKAASKEANGSMKPEKNHQTGKEITKSERRAKEISLRSDNETYTTDAKKQEIDEQRNNKDTLKDTTDAVQVIESAKINDLQETGIVQTNDLHDRNAVQDSLKVDFAQRMKAKYLSISQMLAHRAKNAQLKKNLHEISTAKLYDLHQNNTAGMGKPHEIKIEFSNDPHEINTAKKIDPQELVGTCAINPDGIHTLHANNFPECKGTQRKMEEQHQVSMSDPQKQVRFERTHNDVEKTVENSVNTKPSLINQKRRRYSPVSIPEFDLAANDQYIPVICDTTVKPLRTYSPKLIPESNTDSDDRSVPDCSHDHQTNPESDLVALYDQQYCKQPKSTDPSSNKHLLSLDSSPNSYDQRKWAGNGSLECKDVKITNNDESHSASDSDPRMREDPVSLARDCSGSELKSCEVPRPPVVDDTGDFTLFESHPIASEDLKPADSNLTFTELTELIVGLLKDFGGSPESFQSHEGDQMAANGHASKPGLGFIAPTEGSKSDSDQNLKLYSMTTNGVNNPGKFGFSFSFDNDPNSKETNRMIYSKALGKLYVHQFAYIPVTFHLNNLPPSGCIIRATVAYAEPGHASSPPHRCQKHAKADTEVPPGCETHLVSCRHHQSQYFEHPMTGQHSVTVPLQEQHHYSTTVPTSTDTPDKSGFSSVTYLYKFHCSSSCAGLKHHPIKLVFTLEESNMIFGRQAVDLRICAIPNQDLVSKDFMGRGKNPQTGESSAKSQGNMQVISHGLDVETQTTDVKEQDVDRQRGDKDSDNDHKDADTGKDKHTVHNDNESKGNRNEDNHGGDGGNGNENNRKDQDDDKIFSEDNGSDADEDNSAGDEDKGSGDDNRKGKDSGKDEDKSDAYTSIQMLTELAWLLKNIIDIKEREQETRKMELASKADNVQPFTLTLPSESSYVAFLHAWTFLNQFDAEYIYEDTKADGSKNSFTAEQLLKECDETRTAFKQNEHRDGNNSVEHKQLHLDHPRGSQWQDYETHLGIL